MTHRQAMLFALAAFFCWVLLDVSMKLGAQALLSPFMVMAITGMVGVLAIGGASLYKKRIQLLRPTNMRGQGLIVFCTVLINFVNVVALKHLPLTVFYVAVFTAPLVSAGLSSVMKHEVLSVRKVVCLVVGFLGVVLAAAPQGWDGGAAIGYLAVAISVSCFAVATVAMRQTAQTDSVESLQFVNAASVCVVGLIGVLLRGEAMPESLMVLTLIVGGCFNVLGNLSYNIALKHTTSSNVMQLHYTQIISGALIGYLLWHEVPTWNLIIGSMAIIASGIAVAAQAHLIKKPEEELGSIGTR